jgi:predicted RNase H-like HicB family nuclease
MKDYHINIFYSEEDRGYVADIPDLACCSAFGETAEEALAAVLRAQAVWMEAAKAEGKPIPPPTFKPVIYQLSEVPA